MRVLRVLSLVLHVYYLAWQLKRKSSTCRRLFICLCCCVEKHFWTSVTFPDEYIALLVIIKQIESHQSCEKSRHEKAGLEHLDGPLVLSLLTLGINEASSNLNF